MALSDEDYKHVYRNTRENYRWLIDRVDVLLKSRGEQRKQMEGILRASMPHIKEDGRWH
tara:strand:+ start:868 stop:1044 length:177 start_codon:yes stop_codon:yes gene_type:complete